MLYALPFALAFLLIVAAVYVLLRESKPRRAAHPVPVLSVHVADKPYA